MGIDRATARWLARACVVAISVAALACQILTSLERPDDSAFDAGVDAPSLPPSPPLADDVPYACSSAVLSGAAAARAGGEKSIVFAVSTFDTTPRRDAGTESCATSGFDLDGKSTCSSDGGHRPIEQCNTNDAASVAEAYAACPWGPSCRPLRLDALQTQCDGPGGVDNALGVLLAQVRGLLGGESSLEFNDFIRRGGGNLLVRLENYDEMPEDDDVSVSFFESSGLAPSVTPDPDADFLDGHDVPKVRWDGRSVREWYLAPGSLQSVDPVNPFKAAKYTYSGRVRNGVLVVRADVVPFGLGLINGEVRDVLFTAEVTRLSDGSWMLVRGRMGGSIATRTFLYGALRVPFVSAGKEVTACQVSTLATQFVDKVCQTADIADDAGNCERLSVGAAFTAVPAILGPVRELATSNTPCDLDAGCQ